MDSLDSPSTRTHQWSFQNGGIPGFQNTHFPTVLVSVIWLKWVNSIHYIIWHHSTDFLPKHIHYNSRHQIKHLNRIKTHIYNFLCFALSSCIYPWYKPLITTIIIPAWPGYSAGLAVLFSALLLYLPLVQTSYNYYNHSRMTWLLSWNSCAVFCSPPVTTLGTNLL